MRNKKSTNHPKSATSEPEQRATGTPKLQKRQKLASRTESLAIGLLANRSLRSGPQSQLISFLREFEHYFRNILKARLFAVDGTYRAILRAGLFRDYGNLHRISAGHHGGIVPITAMAVRKVEDADNRPYLDSVIYLLDPRDPTSTYPESIALKRECVVAKKPFLATYSAAQDWATLAWFSSSDTKKFEYFLDRELLARLMARDSIASSSKALENQTIALIAHDKKKKEILKFACQHLDLLRRFRSRQATGTTGTLLNGERPKTSRLSRREMLKLQPEFGKLSRLRRDKQLTAWVYPQPSGPRGGDVQIAELVLSGQCHKVLFFEDPHVSREHEADIQLLERTCRIPENNITCLHDYTTASEWANNLRRCVAAGMPVPVTLSRAFRLLFDTELVLCQYSSDIHSHDDTWASIVEAAAYFVLGTMATVARSKADLADKAGAIITWGYAMHELCQAMQTVGADLEKLGESLKLDPPIADRHYLRPGNVFAAPMVGIMGTTDPRVEATQNAYVFSTALGGEPVLLSSCAFIDRGVTPPPDHMRAAWDTADVAVFTCEMIKEQFGSKALAPMPPRLYEQMKDQAVGEVGGMFLDDHGGEIEPRNYSRIGMRCGDLRQVAKRGGAILIAGAQEQRVKPALACLRGRLVSTLVTDRAFAWRVLRAELQQKAGA